jgi:hypothetical protein
MNFFRSLLSRHRKWSNLQRGFDFAPSGFSWKEKPAAPTATDNPLRDFFNARKSGPGIWKWLHYFDIYHEHLNAFRGRDVHVLEIGIYSGGSLDMWKDYFGSRCHIYGADIEPACKVYERTGHKIFIGDQVNRSFWKHFRKEVPLLDVVIDDGGHEPEQQIVTLEELLPYMRPGGVFICEDVHGEFNRFALYVIGMAQKLNSMEGHQQSSDDERRIVVNPNEFQTAIYSVHLYPYVTVIKKNAIPLTDLRAPKHGTEWQPFLQ